MAPGMVQPLGIDVERQRGPAREVVSGSPRRAFGLGVLVGGLACAGLALVALSSGDALAADMVTSFAGPAVPLPRSARSGFPFGQAAAPAAYGRDITMTAGVTADPPVAPDSTAVRLKAERYVATNRFFVKEGKQAQFEQRWATRKSRLAELNGFSSFALLRRINGGSEEPNYVSFTVWEDVEAFTEWRQGSAFKEAHGGGSLWGFLTAILTNVKILSGAPKPAFYDGLLPVTPPVKSMPEAVDGWRNVTADGVNKLPADMVVAMRRFSIEKDTEGFEQAFKAEADEGAAASPGGLAELPDELVESVAKAAGTSDFPGGDAFLEEQRRREEARAAGQPLHVGLKKGANQVRYNLKEVDGFVASYMLRRDAPQADDGNNYVFATVWRDLAALEAWRGAAGPKDLARSKLEAWRGAAGAEEPAAVLAQYPQNLAIYEGILSLYAPDYNTKNAVPAAS